MIGLLNVRKDRVTTQRTQAIDDFTTLPTNGNMHGNGPKATYNCLTAAYQLRSIVTSATSPNKNKTYNQIPVTPKYVISLSTKTTKRLEQIACLLVPRHLLCACLAGLAYTQEESAVIPQRTQSFLGTLSPASLPMALPGRAMQTQ